jgi:hypothetical protein
MGMSIPRFVANCVIVGLLILVAGCATEKKEHERPRVSADTQPAAAAVVETAPLLAFEEGERRFVATLGSQKGQTLVSTLKHDGDGRWRYDLEGSRTVYLRQDDTGTYVEREIDMTEKVEVTYEPALQMLPAQLTRGEPVSNTVRMTVRNLADGKVRDQGTCELTCEFVGVETVQTPAGDFEAHIVHATRRIDLALAKVLVEVEESYAVGVGTVVETIRRDTKALGLFSIKSEEEVRRLEK